MSTGSAISAMVIEDSILAREGLIDMLSKFPIIKIVGQAEHPDSAITAIRELQPTLLFLDIHMPGKTGFDLLEQLDYEPLIIFTTAYSEYAIRSFDFQTIDYLMKPISKYRLEQAMDKLESHVAGPSTVEKKEKMDTENRLFVKGKEDCHIVALTEIEYFESCKNYVRIFFGNKSAFIKKSLNQVESRVPDSLFFRCSRQHIINLRKITAIEETVNDGFLIVLKGDKKISVSRRNSTKLKSLLSF